MARKESVIGKLSNGNSMPKWCWTKVGIENKRHNLYSTPGQMSPGGWTPPMVSRFLIKDQDECTVGFSLLIILGIFLIY